MTLNQILEKVAELHPDHAETMGYLLSELPRIELQTTYEQHRWYVNVKLNDELVKVGNL